MNKAILEEACTITINERCSAVLLNKMPSKEKDPRRFTIPYDIGELHINNALADLGASISLMPYMMYEKLGLGEPKPTRMSLELADRILPNFDRTRRSRKDNVHLSTWDFAYRRMPFRLCNAPATFQRCMKIIFHDMVEDFMEVFMDDFSVFGQKISGARIEVDRAKIDVITKLPYLTNVKGVRSFLGHAGFYRRLKKDQEKDKIISKPDKNGKCGEAGKSRKQLQ
nr:DNA-directed DNA polymerase [Tanacetum cinerariifolium]